jgi:hypothetical protein
MGNGSKMAFEAMEWERGAWTGLFGIRIGRGGKLL